MLTFWTWGKIGMPFHWNGRKEGKISDDTSEISSEVKRWVERTHTCWSLLPLEDSRQCHLLKREKTVVFGTEVGGLRKMVTYWKSCWGKKEVYFKGQGKVKWRDDLIPALPQAPQFSQNNPARKLHEYWCMISPTKLALPRKQHFLFTCVFVPIFLPLFLHSHFLWIFSSYLS